MARLTSSPVTVSVDLPMSLEADSSCRAMMPSISTCELPPMETTICTRVKIGSKKPLGRRLVMIEPRLETLKTS
jgi:hypothetical protein